MGVVVLQNCSSGGSGTPEVFSSVMENTTPFDITADDLKGLKSLNDYAFYGSNLRSIEIPSTVTSISSNSFIDCNNLSLITLQQGNPNYTAEGNCIIQNSTIVKGCGSSTIPNSVYYIGENAFKGCGALTTITIPNNISNIYSGAFTDCKNLQTLIVSGTPYVSGGAFNGCDSLRYIQGSTSSIDSVVSGIDSSSLTASITDTSISAYALQNKTKITELEFPNGVTSIGFYAFGNIGISELIFDTTPSINSYAFENCAHLEYLEIPNPPASGSISTSFSGCPIKTAKVYAGLANRIPKSSLESIEITSGTSIGDYAFDGSSNLSTIILPNTITSVGYYAFRGCDNLTTVNFKGTLADWCNISFSTTYDYSNPISKSHSLYLNGVQLIDAVIPSTVSTIKPLAFDGLSTMRSLTVEGTSTTVGTSAFRGCTGLKTITGTPELASGVINEAGYSLSDISLILTTGFTNSSLFRNKTYITSVDMSNNTTNIPTQTFQGCTGLTNIVIKDNTTSIGTYAFYNCSNLLTATIGSAVSTIDNQAFYGCTKLIEIYNKSGLNLVPGSTDYGYVAYYAKHVYTNPGDSYLSTDANGYVIYDDSVKSLLVEYNGNETNLTLPVVDEINDRAFQSNTSITSVVVPSGVSSIGALAFNGCTGLTAVQLSNTLTSIGDSAFNLCTSISSITIPATVATVGAEAFRWDTGLLSITVDSNTVYDATAFQNCTAIEDVYYTGTLSDWVANSKIFMGSVPTTYPRRTLHLNGALLSGNIQLPNDITTLDEFAFYYCDQITSIDFNNVQSLPAHLCYGCDSLTSVSLSSAFNRIYGEPFSGCPNLTDIYYAGTIDDWCSIVRNYTSDFINLSGKSLYCNGVKVEGSVSVPLIQTTSFYGYDAITSLTITGNQASGTGLASCMHCVNLTSVSLPSSVYYISDQTFMGCTSLTSVSLTSPSTRGTISYNAFDGCSSLQSITIPSGYDTIKDRAFANCTSLTSVTLDADTIVDSAFNGCTNLTTVFYTGSLTKWCNATYLQGLTVPAYAQPKDYYIGGVKVEHLVIPSGITTIKSNRFDGFLSLLDLDTNEVTTINSYGFERCSNLTSITFGNSLLSIGDYAFRNCTSLTSLTIPESVTYISSLALQGCTELTTLSVDSNNTKYRSENDCIILKGSTNRDTLVIGCKNSIIPDDGSLGVIGDNAFNSSEIASVTIPSGIYSIQTKAFYNCKHIPSITIPSSVTSIGSQAFAYCTSLESVTYLGNVSLSSDMFSGDTAVRYARGSVSNVKVMISQVSGSGLVDVSFANGSGIPQNAFQRNNKVKSIVVESPASSIGAYAFRGCSYVTSITLPVVSSINTYAFMDCSRLVDINFNGTKAQWNSITFGNYWNYNTGNYVIHCTDGDIAKS